MRAEALAQLFHDEYERLAPEFGYTTRRSSALPWEKVPEPNKSLMIAVARKVLRELGIEEGEEGEMRETETPPTEPEPTPGEPEPDEPEE